jgi:hypothetical protein
MSLKIISLSAGLIFSCQAWASGDLTRISIAPRMNDATRTCDYNYSATFRQFPDFEIFRTCTASHILSKQSDGLCSYDKTTLRSYVEQTAEGQYRLGLYAVGVPYSYEGNPPNVVQCGTINAAILIR